MVMMHMQIHSALLKDWLWYFHWYCTVANSPDVSTFVWQRLQGWEIVMKQTNWFWHVHWYCNVANSLDVSTFAWQRLQGREIVMQTALITSEKHCEICCLSTYWWKIPVRSNRSHGFLINVGWLASNIPCDHHSLIMLIPNVSLFFFIERTFLYNKCKGVENWNPLNIS